MRYKDYLMMLLNSILRDSKCGKIPYRTQQLIKYHNGKYPKNNITYKGILISDSIVKTRPNILVTDYIHVTESMKKWIKSKKLEYKGDFTPESISKHAWKVYSEFVKHTKYYTDEKLYGINEYWVPTMEQFYIKNYAGKWVGDCENLALLCISLLYASGLPRGLFRIVAGDTDLGGHATLFVWDWRTNQFEQWETTATFPMQVQEHDKIAIKRVWFSFDIKYSWSTINKSKYKKIVRR